jgi:hypothetical protein
MCYLKQGDGVRKCSYGHAAQAKLSACAPGLNGTFVGPYMSFAIQVERVVLSVIVVAVQLLLLLLLLLLLFLLFQIYLNKYSFSSNQGETVDLVQLDQNEAAIRYVVLSSVVPHPCRRL